MRKWIWLLLAVLVAFTAVVSGGFFRQGEQLAKLEITKANPLEKKAIQQEKSNCLPPVELALSFPGVSASRLFAHVENLNFQRYTDAQRSRTRDYITTQLKNFGWKVQLQPFPQGVNIFAERQGTNPKAGAILVGAHYDTVAISPGADDNATGVAVLLEIARLFASRPTPRTLQLLFFDKEEAGLLGSKAFVTQKAQSLKHLRGAIVMDMVGYACHVRGCQQYPASLPVTPPSDKGDFLAVVGDTEHPTLLNVFQNLGQKMAIPITSKLKQLSWVSLPSIFTLPVPFKGLLIPDTLRSDHAPFWLQGVGAVLVTDTANLRTPHYHQPSDVPKTIDRNFFTGAAQIVINATATLAQTQDTFQVGQNKTSCRQHAQTS
jgi:hypothetical protein